MQSLPLPFYGHAVAGEELLFGNSLTHHFARVKVRAGVYACMYVYVCKYVCVCGYRMDSCIINANSIAYHLLQGLLEEREGET